MDAATLAQLLRADLLPEAWIAPQGIGDLRALLRHRAALVRLSTSLKNRIHAVLANRGIAQDRILWTVLGGRGWPAWSCPRSHGRSSRTAAGCWMPWPPRSPGWDPARGRPYGQAQPAACRPYAQLARRRGTQIATVAIAGRLLARSFPILKEVQTATTTGEGQTGRARVSA